MRGVEMCLLQWDVSPFSADLHFAIGENFCLYMRVLCRTLLVLIFFERTWQDNLWCFSDVLICILDLMTFVSFPPRRKRSCHPSTSVIPKLSIDFFSVWPEDKSFIAVFISISTVNKSINLENRVIGSNLFVFCHIVSYRLINFDWEKYQNSAN